MTYSDETAEGHPTGRTDWARLARMTDAEAEANALSDPDAQPWTDEMLTRARASARADAFVRLEDDVADAYRSLGPDWRRHVNEVLRTRIGEDGKVAAQ